MYPKLPLKSKYNMKVFELDLKLVHQNMAWEKSSLAALRNAKPQGRRHHRHNAVRAKWRYARAIPVSLVGRKIRWEG